MLVDDESRRSRGPVGEARARTDSAGRSVWPALGIIIFVSRKSTHSGLELLVVSQGRCHVREEKCMKLKANICRSSLPLPVFDSRTDRPVPGAGPAAITSFWEWSRLHPSRSPAPQQPCPSASLFFCFLPVFFSPAEFYEARKLAVKVGFGVFCWTATVRRYEAHLLRFTLAHAGTLSGNLPNPRWVRIANRPSVFAGFG